MEAEAFAELEALEQDHWWFRGMRQITATLAPHTTGNGRLRLLDAGCGVGGNLKTFREWGLAFGLDYSSDALMYARQYHPGKLARASVEALPYRSNYFDLVTSFDVLDEVPGDVQALREFGRVLRPGGFVLLRLPAMPLLRGAHDDYIATIRRYDAGPLRAKLTEAGLAVRRMTYANSVLLPLIFVIRKTQRLRMRLGQQGGESDISLPSAPVNRLLAGVLAVEAGWIGRGGNFPAGVSLFALAEKPEQD